MSRLDVLLARAAAEKWAAQSKAEKPAKPAKIAKPRAPRPEPAPEPVPVAPVAQEPHFVIPNVSLIDSVKQLTAAELSEPNNIAMVYALFVGSELAQCPNPTLKALTDRSLEATAELQAEVWSMTPNIKRCSLLAFQIVDSIEIQTAGFEDEAKMGSAIRRLRELEHVITARRLELNTEGR